MQTVQWLGLVSLLGGGSLAGPGWRVGDSYQDMVRLMGTYQPRVESILGDLESSFDQNVGIMGSQFENFGNKLEDHFESLGSQMGQGFEEIGTQFDKHLSSLGSNLDEFGSQIENSYKHQLGQFDVLGTNLMSQFDDHLDSIPFGHNVDVFGMFGKTRTPWWKKANVCIEREVLEEKDDEPKNVVNVTSEMNYHMQVNQCVEGEDYYQCTNTVADDGTVKTLKMTYSCCHGFKKTGRGDCTEVEIQPMEETIEDLGGKEFLNLLMENEMDNLLRNVTVFVPNDEAVEDFKRDMAELNTFTQAENIVYSVDDGLIYKRKKRSIMIVEQPELTDILAGHIVEGFVNSKDFVNEELLSSANTDNDKIRVTTYATNPKQTVMANCARVTSKDNHATTGVVHMVDKVILPAKNTIADILATDLQFKTFVSALEENNLSEMLTNDGHFTVFAPTDEAFEKLDEDTREKVLGGGGCAKDIIRSHILPNIICSGIVENKIKVTNILGHTTHMHRDEDGNIHVGGVKLMMKDKMATNGVIHVIEDVVIHKSISSVIDHLKKKNSEKLLTLLEKAGLIKTLDNMSNLTFFPPSEKAISEIPKEVLEELVKDEKKLEEILLHHIATEKKGSCHLTNNQHLETAGGGKLRINLHKHFGHMHALGTVQCARIIENDENVCGGKVHTIDRVLTPPSGNLVDTLKKDHSKFHKLIEFSGIKTELTEGLHTILAPLDSSFDKLDEDAKSKMFEDKEIADSVVRNHILNDVLCCAGVPRISGFFQTNLKRRSGLGETISIRRSNGGHMYANQAAVVRCDLAATNGVVHSVADVLLPSKMEKNKGTQNKKFWIF